MGEPSVEKKKRCTATADAFCPANIPTIAANRRIVTPTSGAERRIAISRRDRATVMSRASTELSHDRHMDGAVWSMAPFAMFDSAQTPGGNAYTLLRRSQSTWRYFRKGDM